MRSPTKKEILVLVSILNCLYATFLFLCCVAVIERYQESSVCKVETIELQAEELPISLGALADWCSDPAGAQLIDHDGKLAVYCSCEEKDDSK